MKKSFLIYTDYESTIWHRLSDAEVGRLVRAIAQFHTDGCVKDDEYFNGDRAVLTAYDRMIGDARIANEKYEKRVLINHENAVKGGRPKKNQTEAKRFTQNQSKPNRFLEIPSKADNVNGIINANDKYGIVRNEDLDAVMINKIISRGKTSEV